MTTRLSAIAAALALSLVAPSAFAQSDNGPAGIGWQARASSTLDAGSIRDARFVSSAKAGNAEQNAQAVPSYGMTSGGPRH